MQDAPHIHFATHGFVGSDYPKGVLLLTPDADAGDGQCCNARDECCASDEPCRINCTAGLLSAEELARSQLSARLVVLSACQTGQGEVKGEGLVGLSRAIIQAGVPCSVLSLWAVDDKATLELMDAMYDCLLGGQPVAAALRSAMLQMMRDPARADPRFWNPFFCSGCGSVKLGNSSTETCNRGFGTVYDGKGNDLESGSDGWETDDGEDNTD